MILRQSGPFTIVLQQMKALLAVPEACQHTSSVLPTIQGRPRPQSSNHTGINAEESPEVFAGAATKLQALLGKIFDICRSVRCLCSYLEQLYSSKIPRKAEAEAFHHTGHRQCSRKTPIFKCLLATQLRCDQAI